MRLILAVNRGVGASFGLPCVQQVESILRCCGGPHCRDLALL